MCVIIHKPAGKELAEEDILNAAKANPHGFGYMYYDPEKKKIVAEKSLFTEKTLPNIVAICKSLTPYEAAFHFRIRTHGKIADSTCHPFKVLDKKKHGVEMFFMHNGTISGVKEEVDESDTQAFNRQVLQPILKAKPLLIKSEAVKLLIEDFIGGSKLLVMFGDGEVLHFNKAKGDTYKDMWVSNKNFVPYQSRHTNQCNRASDKDDTKYYEKYWGENSMYQSGYDKPEGKLVDEDVKKGDKVWILHQHDLEFSTIGEIVRINTYLIHVKFTDKTGKVVEVSFVSAKGESTMDNPGYFALPDVPANFVEDEKEEVVEKDSSAEKKSSIINLPMTIPNSTTIEEDKKKEENSFLVSCGDITVDHKDRYGGAFVDSIDDLYGRSPEDFMSVFDFYKATPQERLDWFIKNPQASFGMLQDLAESKVYDELEYEDLGDETEDSEEKRLRLMRSYGAL